jgi:glyceraldehyde 3-phosphate dehydrogenase
VRVLSEPVPGRLPWKELGVDIVVEATGRFVNGGAGEHLKAGAGRVIVSAPSTEADLTIVMGVNHADFDPSRHLIVSNASCTTNCLAPIARVIHDAFGIEKGLVTTIHSYTNDQKLMDSPHKDFRRGRSAALSIIPTTTGAAGAVGQVLPELKGKLDGVSVRVPTPDVSLADITLCLSKKTSAEEANLALKTASEGKLSGILGYSEDPLVSVDYLGSTYSAVVDSLQTRVMGGDLLKISAWYDNEWGYATRLAELILHLAPG